MKWIIGTIAIVAVCAMLLVGYSCFVVGARADRQTHDTDENQ